MQMQGSEPGGRSKTACSEVDLCQFSLDQNVQHIHGGKTPSQPVNISFL